MSELSHIKELVMGLPEKERDSLYEMLFGDKVKRDIISLLRLGGYDVPPEEEREEFAKEIAEAYVFSEGLQKTYNAALTELVKDAIADYEADREHQ